MSANGYEPRRWEPSEDFNQAARDLEPCVPRLRQILKGVKLELMYHAETSRGSARLSSGGGYWLHGTEAAGDDTPALLIYYRVERGRVIPDWIELAP